MRLNTILLLVLTLVSGEMSIALAPIIGSHSRRSSSATGAESQTGTVSCRVIDSDKKPVSAARVAAISRSGNTGSPPEAVTNREGIFTLNNLRAGKYYLSVAKEEAGYPDFWNRFYAAGYVDVLQVEVYPGQIVSCGEIQLGPKAGKLVGTLSDAKTRRPIIGGGAEQKRHLILCRADDPKNCNDANPHLNGSFGALVPPVPFTIEATAPGYDAKRIGPLRLKSGEVKRLDILLNRHNRPQ